MESGKSPVLGANGQPVKSSAKPLTYDVHHIRVDDPGKTLGLMGNISLGMQQTLFYVKNPLLFVQRFAGSMAVGLLGFTLFFVLINFFFGGGTRTSFLDNPAKSVGETIGNGLRQPINYVGEKGKEAFGRNQQEQPLENPSSFPNGFQP